MVAYGRRVFSRGFTLLLVAVTAGAGSLAAASMALGGDSRGLLVLDLVASLGLLASLVKAWSLGVSSLYWLPLSLSPVILAAKGLLPGGAVRAPGVGLGCREGPPSAVRGAGDSEVLLLRPRSQLDARPAGDNGRARRSTRGCWSLRCGGW